MRVGNSIAAWLLVLLTLLAGALKAQDNSWRKVYIEAHRAYNFKDWSTAAVKFAEVIALAPNESPTNVELTGGNPRRYLPHFYRGLALVQLGRCEEAVREFETSRNQGVIQGFAKLSNELDTAEAACRQRLPKSPVVAEVTPPVEAPVVETKPVPPPPTGPSAAEINAATAAGRQRLDDLRAQRTKTAASLKNPALAGVAAANSLRAQFDRSNDVTRRLEAALAKPPSDQAALTQLNQLAAAAADETSRLRGVASQAQTLTERALLAASNTQRQQLEAAELTRAQEALVVARQQAQRILDTKAGSTDPAVATLRTLLERSRATPSTAAAATALAAQLDDATNRVIALVEPPAPPSLTEPAVDTTPTIPAADQPPAALLEAASAWARGDIDATLASAQAIGASASPRARRVGAVLAAAALFDRARRTGSPADQAEAQRLLREAPEPIRPEALGQRSFSPAFRAFATAALSRTSG